MAIEDARARFRAIDGEGDRWAVQIDGNKLMLPPVPEREDRGGLCMWLTAVCSMDASNPVSNTARPGDLAVIERRSGQRLWFEPYAVVCDPKRFRAALCSQLHSGDGQPYGYRAEHVHQIEYVVRVLAEGGEREDLRARARAILATFLQDADEVGAGQLTSYGDGVEKFRLIAALQADRYGSPRYAIDRESDELLVRVSDMLRAARVATGQPAAVGTLDGYMAELGFTRVKCHGRERPRPERGHYRKVSLYRGVLDDED